MMRQNWYLISADGGETWTEQLLTPDEVMTELDMGHLCKRGNAYLKK